MDNVLVCWSGGKDSTAATLLHMRRGDRVCAVYYVPYLCEAIPLITKDHYEFINKMSARLQAVGVRVIEAGGVTYEQHVKKVLTRGPRKGQYMGFGLGFGFCQFRNYSKCRAVSDIAKCVVHDYMDIGIAYDEVKRQGQLVGDKRSILVEQGITESMAKSICIEADALSPVYKYAGRDGCVICPNGNKDRLLAWARDYPEGVKKLFEIELFCRNNCTKGKVYRDGTFWSDRLFKEVNTWHAM